MIFPNIRQANQNDISRIAEILIFTKRMNYRPIFQNDKVSFGELQVVPLANLLLKDEKLLQEYWVYDDEFIKGIIHIRGMEIVELYVDCFFEGQGVGGMLLEYAKQNGANWLWVLEKNGRAQNFYQKHGFIKTGERKPEEGTPEYVMKMTCRKK